MRSMNCSDRLIEANLKNKPELLDEVVKLLTPIRDTWKPSVNRAA